MYFFHKKTSFVKITVMAIDQSNQGKRDFTVVNVLTRFMFLMRPQSVR